MNRRQSDGGSEICSCLIRGGASAIESVGVPSSSVIVTVPVATEIAEFVGLLKPIVKVSSNSL